MSKRNIYDMILGVKTHFVNMFPGHLRIIETDVGGGLRLTDPAEYAIGYRDPYTSAHYPLFCFIATDVSSEASANHAENLQPSIDILLAINNSKPDELEENLLLYADAIRNLIGDDESLGGTCQYSEITGIRLFHGALEAKNQAVVIVTISIYSEIVT